jgi:hypothetical protein
MPLTPEGRRLLEDYRDAVEEVGRTKLGQKGFNVSYTVGVGAGTLTLAAESMPDEADLAELVMCFRPIWDDREPASFGKATSVLLREGDLPPDEQRELAEICADWKRAGRESPIRVGKLRPRRFIEMYFYSDRYFHRGTPEQRKAREAFEADLGRNFTRLLFIDPIIEYTRAAVDLAQLVVRCSRDRPKRQQTGTGYRAGPLPLCKRRSTRATVAAAWRLRSSPASRMTTRTLARRLLEEPSDPHNRKRHGPLGFDPGGLYRGCTDRNRTGPEHTSSG